MTITVNVLLRSEYWGHGKTVTALSFKPEDGSEPKRLVIDPEYRDENYKSPDVDDHPEKLQFAFDFFRDRYNDMTPASLVKMYQEISQAGFPYNTIVFDNVAIFQDELYVMLADKAAATTVGKGIPSVEARNKMFLQYQFNPNNPGGYYPFLRSVVKEILLACRKSAVNVVATTESRNVWENWGTRDQKNLGQTAKAWDPWFQFSDVVLVLSRVEGDRMSGKAKMLDAPHAVLDTFNTKCSIPGIVPEFVFKNWDVFWKMARQRQIPTASDFAKIKIDAGSTPETDTAVQTIADAKKIIAQRAVASGIMANTTDKAGAAKLKELGAKHSLDMDNALAQLDQWLRVIEEESNDQ